MVLSGSYSMISVLNIDDHATYVLLQLRQKPVCVAVLGVWLVGFGLFDFSPFSITVRVLCGSQGATGAFCGYVS